MGSSDFSSMPSEPQDIGKWFSSYVYESPHLSSEDKREEDFQDSVLSIVTETEECEDRGKEYSVGIRNFLLRKCKNVGEDSSPREPPFCNVQLQHAEESVKGRTDHVDEDHICCLQDSCVSIVPETEESEDNITEKTEEQNLCKRQDFLLDSCKNISRGKCSREVLEYADSIIPVSEPPDLKNWFDSYVYESPTLDAGHELGLWSNVDCKDEEDIDAPNHTDEKKVLLSKSIGNAEREVLISQRAASGGLAKNSVEDKDPQHEYYHKENRNVNAIQQVDKLNDSTTDQDISCQILPEKGTQQEYDSKSTPQKNSPRKNHVLRDTVICDENYDPSMEDLNPAMRAKNCNNIDEETGRNEAAEDEGFISTRRSRNKHAQKEKSFQNMGLIKPEIQRIGVYNPSNSNAIKKTPPKREALQEWTNIQSLNMFEEKKGKWRCPQNTKPYIGPPLKQLRLDQWVRRVRNL